MKTARGACCGGRPCLGRYRARGRASGCPSACSRASATRSGRLSPAPRPNRTPPGGPGGGLRPLVPWCSRLLTLVRLVFGPGCSRRPVLMVRARAGAASPAWSAWPCGMTSSLRAIATRQVPAESKKSVKKRPKLPARSAGRPSGMKMPQLDGRKSCESEVTMTRNARTTCRR